MVSAKARRAMPQGQATGVTSAKLTNSYPGRSDPVEVDDDAMEGGIIPSKVGELRIMQTTPAIYQTLNEQATTLVPFGWC